MARTHRPVRPLDLDPVTLVMVDPPDDRYDVLIWGGGVRFPAFKRAIQRKVGDRIRNVFAVRRQDRLAEERLGSGTVHRVRQRRVRVNHDAKVFDRRAGTRNGDAQPA